MFKGGDSLASAPTSAPASLSGFSLFIGYQQKAGNADFAPLFSWGNAAATRIEFGLGGAGYGSTNGVMMHVANGSDAGFYEDNVAVSGGGVEASVVFDGTQTGNSSRLTYARDNALDSSVTYFGAVPATTPPSAASVTVGGDLGSATFVGDIGELLFYDRALNSTDRGAVDTYLSSRYAGLPYAPLIVADSPTYYWHLDDLSGTIAVDSAGNDTGTYQGAETLGDLTGIRAGAGTAVTFDGATGYISTAQSLNDPQTFSVEAWFKTTTTQGGAIMGFCDGQQLSCGSWDRLLYMTNAGTLIWGIYTGSLVTIASPASYNDGQWHHVVASVDGSFHTYLYVDGVNVANNTANGTPPQNYVGYWHIGANKLGGWTSEPSSWYLNGSLDEVAYYATPLSSTQVANHYNRGRFGQ